MIEIESPIFNKKKYDEYGVYVVRNAISQTTIEEWQYEWKQFYNQKLSEGRDVHQANPVALKEQPSGKLAYMYRNKELVNLAKQVHGENVALYGHRFVIKDKFSLDKVFLHQDSCYHLGYLNKCSFFVPLSIANESNGGLSFYLGSHKCGYLGDAGEISVEGVGFKFEKITPEIYPGDIVIMNSHVWHESGPNIDKIDRIIADIHYQPSNDPTGRELLSGEWETDFWYSIEDPTKYFKNSRILKIKNNEKSNNNRS